MKYYNISKIAAKKCEYNIIYGGRASGKSFQMGAYLLDDYIHNGHQFVRLIRSWGQAKGLDSYFEEILDNDSVKYKGIKVKLVQDQGLRYECNGETFGYIIPLSMQHNYKSSQYPKVVNVVFEEFVAPSPMDYLDGDGEVELNAFRSALSTIFRHRTGRVWLVGNSINTSNPYFEFFGIDGSQLEVGDLKVYTRTMMLNGKEVPAASCAVEWVPIGYTDPNEIPIMMRVPDNEIAISGAIEESSNVSDKVMPVYNESGYMIGAVVEGSSMMDPVYLWSWGEDEETRRFYMVQVAKGDLYIWEDADLKQVRNKIQLQISDPYPEDMRYISKAYKVTDPDPAKLSGGKVKRVYFNSSATEYHFVTAATAYGKNKRFVQSIEMGNGFDVETQDGRQGLRQFADERRNMDGGYLMDLVAQNAEKDMRMAGHSGKHRYNI